MLIPPSRPSSLRTLACSIGVVALVGVACATQPPANPSSSPTTGPAQAGDATSWINETVHHAIIAIYGKHAPPTAGTPAQFWVVLNADGSVRRHDVGRADLVELSKDDPMREKMKDLPGPLYSVNASLKKKYPDLDLDNPKKVEIAGGGPIALGTDTAMVFWAKLAK